MYILLAILMLEVIIMIHEFGHFLVAKRFGVGIIEYSIGMGPIIFAKRIGETVYSLRAFLIGGYCAMVGEQSVEASDKGSEKRKAKKKRREPDYKTDWRDDQKYSEKTKGQQFLILIAGPAFNMISGFAIAILTVMIFGSNVKPVISDMPIENSPAIQAGVEIGDEILKVNNRNVLTYLDFKTYLNTHANKTKDGYNLTVKKTNGDVTTYFVTPDPETNLIGISIDAQIEKKHGLDIIKYGINSGVYWVRTTFDSLYMLLHKTANFSDLSGVVGTTKIVSNTLETAEESNGASGVISTVFQFIIFISINLAIMNMLPLPALDGGRALITYFEGLFEKRLSPRVENMINVVGFGLLLLLMLSTTINDIAKIISGQL